MTEKQLAAKLKKVCMELTDYINEHREDANSILYAARGTLYEARDYLGEPL